MRTSSTAVGGFVLGGIVLVVGAILFFGGLRLFTPTLRAVVFFPTPVAGLTVGAPVTFSFTASDPDGDAVDYVWFFGDGDKFCIQPHRNH